MKILGYALVILGFVTIAGAVGAQDFWEQCHRAADCVAGDAPTTLETLGKVLIGFMIFVIGSLVVYAYDE